MSILNIRFAKRVVERMLQLDVTSLTLRKETSTAYVHVVNNIEDINYVLRRFHRHQITLTNSGDLIVTQYQKEHKNQS